jgi:hypothetical protein
LRNIPAEALLLRWFNWHLEKVGVKEQVANLSRDISDSSKYFHLLHSLNSQVLPQSMVKSSLGITDLKERAAVMLDFAEKIDPAARNFLTADDVVSGSEKLNLCFVAALFNACTGMIPYHEELEKQNSDLQQKLVESQRGNSSFLNLIEELRKRVQELEAENSDLRALLSNKDQKISIVESEKKAIVEKFTEAMGQWKDLKDGYETKVTSLQSQVKRALFGITREKWRVLKRHFLL